MPVRFESHHTVQIGKGKQAYDNAKDFVKEWRHMDLGWVDTNRPPVEVTPTETCEQHLNRAKASDDNKQHTP